MKTFIILKPDAIYRGLVGEILLRFERLNMHIQRIEKQYKDKVWFRQHYSHLLGLDPDYLEPMEVWMTTNPLIGVILSGDPAKAKKIVGVTIAAAPGTIRGDFSRGHGYYNLVHAADPSEVDREIKLFFGDNNED